MRTAWLFQVLGQVRQHGRHLISRKIRVVEFSQLQRLVGAAKLAGGETVPQTQGHVLILVRQVAHPW